MFDLNNLIQAVGLVGIFLIIFAESGMFFAFFFPGDSLLFAAGILAFQGFLGLEILMITCALAAILGDGVGYWMGKRMGVDIFNKQTNVFFNKKNLEVVSKFYLKYGKSTIFFARFVPVVRTFAPIVAGATKMNYRDFLLYNILGGIFWSCSLILGGYFLGYLIPDIGKYLEYIIWFAIFVSVLPFVFSFFKKYFLK
jgi:membrane-associated protein